MDTSSTAFPSGQRRLALSHQPTASSLLVAPSESTSRTIHFRGIVSSVIDHGVGYASAAKGWLKDYLLPRRFATQHENDAPSCDIELGKPEIPDSPDIINHDGTVSDPESRRPTDAKSKRNKKAKKEKRRDYLLFEDSPSFLFWLKESWNDLLFFALSGAVALAIYTALDPLGPRYFPLTYAGQVIFPQLAYPYMKEYVPTWLSAVVSNLVPFAFIGLISIFWIGDFWDCDSAIMGQSYAMSAATLFQSLLKYFIGGFRPHFLEVCDPHPGIPEGYQSIYYDTSICRGNSKHIKEAMASFPSGHATAAFAGFVFLAVWINAKFKVFADYQSRYWQTLLFTCPIAIACLIAASKTIDYWHHWSDVIAGAVIGTLFAFWGYRQVYRSVFDWRYNHEPLPRHFERRGLGRGEMRRDLTAIDFGGWRNLHSKPEATHKELSYHSAAISAHSSTSSSKDADAGSSSIPQVDGTHDITTSNVTYSWPGKRSQSHPGLNLPSLGSSLHCNSVSGRASLAVPTNSGFEIGSPRATSVNVSRRATGASVNHMPMTLKRVTESG